MEKLIVLGDIHGRPIWKEILKKYKNEDCIFIFIGDYFDSYYYNLGDQLFNFNEILEFKKANPDKVILLWGNHDHLYLHQTPDKIFISGYQGDEACHQINYVLSKNYDLLQAAYSYNDTLFTHAGVSITWLKGVSYLLKTEMPDFTAKDIAQYVNYAWNETTYLFNYISGSDPYGNNDFQSPIWIRPQALMKCNQDIKKNLIQIVGHTNQKQIDIQGKSTGKRYFFIDTLGTNQEYLIIKNKAFQSGKIYNYESDKSHES